MIYKTRNAMVNVRQFCPGDFDHIRNIEIKSYDLPWDRKQWRTFILHHTLVAEIEDRVVGFSVNRSEGLMCQILRLAVSPSFRRGQIGTALLHGTIEYRPICTTLIAIATETQLDGHGFLQHHGFAIEKQVSKFPVGLHDFESAQVYTATINQHHQRKGWH